MNIVLLDAQTLGDDYSSTIKKFGNFKSYQITKPNEVVDKAIDADIIITNKVVLNKDTLEKLPNLKLICITATGTNNIDLECAKNLNIQVKNVANYSTQAVAQHTLMLALSLMGKQYYYDNFVKSGKWINNSVFTHINNQFELYEIENKNWGIIGFGNIGQRVAKNAVALGANVKYYSTSGKNSNTEFSKEESLEQLFKNSDIISIHAPLNNTTKNLITKKELSWLKKDAILINVGRGGIVNEIDLALMIKNNNFYYGCDVLENEPMENNHPFLNKDIQNKLIITPHIAWAYKDTRARLLKCVEENIKSFIDSNKK